MSVCVCVCVCVRACARACLLLFLHPVTRYVSLPASVVNCVRFHPDGTVVGACSADRTVKLWDTRSNSLLHHYAGHTDSVTELSFHPTGNYLLSTSKDMTVKVWDLREGHLLYTLHGHTGPVLAGQFASTTGNFFATGGGGEEVVMVWATNFINTGAGRLSQIGADATPTKPRYAAGGRHAVGITSYRRLLCFSYLCLCGCVCVCVLDVSLVSLQACSQGHPPRRRCSCAAACWWSCCSPHGLGRWRRCWRRAPARAVGAS